MTHADLDLEELIDDLAYRYKRGPIGSARGAADPARAAGAA
jgi:hypothetical protein